MKWYEVTNSGTGTNRPALNPLARQGKNDTGKFESTGLNPTWRSNQSEPPTGDDLDA